MFFEAYFPGFFRFFSSFEQLRHPKSAIKGILKCDLDEPTTVFKDLPGDTPV